MPGGLTESRVAASPARGEVLLSAERLSKKFCRDLKRSLFYGVRDIASEVLGRRRQSDRLRPGEFWALRDVDFELRRGEALGLVGANGAGKSTLLRMVSGLIRPDAGRATVRGRVAPLIALGAGFSPVLTGRENIFTNMSILGLTTREIEARFDEVLDFAEIGEAIDAPVRTYSSGMAARLGFACAVHTDPDILLIDEVLAVGDVKFRVKCYRKLAHLRERGTAFVLVSHSPHAIFSVCNRAVYLSGGRLVASGDTGEVMSRYERDLFQTEAGAGAGTLRLAEKPDEQSAGLDILALHFSNGQGEALASPASGRPATLCVRCRARRRLGEVTLSVIIREFLGEGEAVLNLGSDKDGQSFVIEPGEAELQLHLPVCGLRPGVYTAKVYVSEPPFKIYDVVESFRFTVTGDHGASQSLYYQPRAWNALGVEGEARRAVVQGGGDGSS